MGTVVAQTAGMCLQGAPRPPSAWLILSGCVSLFGWAGVVEISGTMSPIMEED